MNMMEEITKSVWREVGKDALKRGVSTLVGESVKAVIEIVKKRQLRRDQYDFQQWKKEQKPETEKEKSDDDEKEDGED